VDKDPKQEEQEEWQYLASKISYLIPQIEDVFPFA
jgi:hypothetical protein